MNLKKSMAGEREIKLKWGQEGMATGTHIGRDNEWVAVVGAGMERSFLDVTSHPARSLPQGNLPLSQLMA